MVVGREKVRPRAASSNVPGPMLSTMAASTRASRVSQRRGANSSSRRARRPDERLARADEAEPGPADDAPRPDHLRDGLLPKAAPTPERGEPRGESGARRAPPNNALNGPNPERRAPEVGRVKRPASG